MTPVKQLWLTAIVLLIAILFFGLSPTDVWVQRHFYNPLTHEWIVDTHNEVAKFIFYDGIKRLLIFVAVFFLFLLIATWKKQWMRSYRRGLIIVVLSSIAVPLVVGSLKAVTNMPCPKSLDIFEGTYPHTCVWEKYPAKECHLEKQKCWPAGHASGGFALLSLIFLFHTRNNKILAGSTAIVIGWSMGSYKMLIGDHFLSHTVITMIVAWLLIVFIALSVDWIMGQKRNA
ncbi:MAG TPA: phosphatase PAP2 family protein [Sulfuricurvum sp.]|nr:MAG: phosphoesterase [Campylobacterales bacterium 16-40-21]OZA02356.1 MAG: phosphoesterase [Sulfuricurvum sp. 17-40-25]HQS67230.1 phosphatase PAP2 family protein [Sulfuricurvum sp.]HQT36023.1 phosphatase PAP2 family protein [Sulfuricurvum sp.]